MNKPKSTKRRIRRHAGLVMLALCLGLVVSGQASADWYVQDTQTHTQLSTANGYLKEIDARLEQIYKQSNVNGETFDTTAYPTKTLQSDSDGKMSKRTDTSTVQASRCPTVSNNTANATQLTLCKDMVTKEVKLNDYLVDMLTLMENRQTQLKTILEERSKITSGSTTEVGSLESNTNRLLALQTQLQIDQMNLQLTVDSYNRYFADQNAKLADYAREQQRGSSSSSLSDAASGAGRTALLTAALATARVFSDGN
ncbi:MAG: hypothetical protein QM601_01830 [Pseudoxanthomonas sp.]